jgi:hypothetical protein
MPIILPPQITPVRQIRLLVQTGAVFRRLARLSWSAADASLYVSPPNSVMPGRVGVIDAPLGAGESGQFNFAGDFIGGAPYLSLHQSGQCHGKAGPDWDRLQTVPLTGHPLDHPAGGHIATVQSFRPAQLPTTATPRHRKRDQALVVSAPSDAGPLVVTLWAFSDRAKLRAAKFAQWLTMRRPSLLGPLYIGIRARFEPVPATPSSPVVAIYGGWGPGATDPTRFVFVITPAVTE